TPSHTQWSTFPLPTPSTAYPAPPPPTPLLAIPRDTGKGSFQQARSRRVPLFLRASVPVAPTRPVHLRVARDVDAEKWHVHPLPDPLNQVLRFALRGVNQNLVMHDAEHVGQKPGVFDVAKRLPENVPGGALAQIRNRGVRLVPVEPEPPPGRRAHRQFLYLRLCGEEPREPRNGRKRAVVGAHRGLHLFQRKPGLFRERPGPARVGFAERDDLAELPLVFRHRLVGGDSEDQ